MIGSHRDEMLSSRVGMLEMMLRSRQHGGQVQTPIRRARPRECCETTGALVFIQRRHRLCRPAVRHALPPRCGACNSSRTTVACSSRVRELVERGDVCLQNWVSLVNVADASLVTWFRDVENDEFAHGGCDHACGSHHDCDLLWSW
mmetsp:Transcript_69268/g.224715  ORF Transcript_69268/g.224715 Transcript_69268/m.224715 type:complete len:146 (-) Transcript_69268:14-451(-)